MWTFSRQKELDTDFIDLDQQIHKQPCAWYGRRVEKAEWRHE